MGVALGERVLEQGVVGADQEGLRAITALGIVEAERTDDLAGRADRWGPRLVGSQRAMSSAFAGLRVADPVRALRGEIRPSPPQRLDEIRQLITEAKRSKR